MGVRRSAQQASESAATEVDLAGVYAACYRQMVGLAGFLLGSALDAEDVAQEAFVKLAGRRLDDPDNAVAYLRRAVVNACTDAARRRKVADKHARALIRPRSAAGADELAGSAFDRAELVVALRKLSPRRRQVVVLRHYCDLSEAAVAELLGISVGAVKSLASRGLAELAKTMEARDE